MLFVLAHLQSLTGSVEVRFKRGHTLAGVLQPFVKPAILFAQRVAFAGLLRQPRFQIGDLCTAVGNVDGNLGPGCFGRLQQTLRSREFLAQSTVFALDDIRSLFKIGRFVTQLAIGRARVVEHRLQGNLLGTLGFDGAQCLADRID